MPPPASHCPTTAALNAGRSVLVGDEAGCLSDPGLAGSGIGHDIPNGGAEGRPGVIGRPGREDQGAGGRCCLGDRSQ
eukprot:11338092-Alexandrium_andersonii.AAC.1